VDEESVLRRAAILGRFLAGRGCLLLEELNGRLRDIDREEAGDSSLLMHCWHTDFEAILEEKIWIARSP